MSHIFKKIWTVFFLCMACIPSAASAQVSSTLVKGYMDMVGDLDDILANLTAIPDPQEMAIGRDIAKRLNKDFTLVRGEAEKRVKELGENLAQYASRKGISYTFYVVNSDILNAFAVSGGHIYVTTAMLNFVDNDDELAGILGHEIAHIDLRHCIRAIQYQIWISRISPDHLDYVRIGYSLLSKGYSQFQELKADQAGVDIMHRAGYDPYQMVRFMEKLEVMESRSQDQSREQGELGQILVRIHEFTRSHPPSRERKEKLRMHIQTTLNP